MKTVEVNSLWKYRKMAGMGQKRLAHLLNHADNSQYSKWERGEKKPSIANALKLAHIFKVPVEVLYADLYQSCMEEVDDKAKAFSCSEEGEDAEKTFLQPSAKVEQQSVLV